MSDFPGTKSAVTQLPVRTYATMSPEKADRASSRNALTTPRAWGLTESRAGMFF